MSKTAYKLFRVLKSGEINSLFINKSEKLKYNEWMEAKQYSTKGFAFRPGWHCTAKPHVPHLKIKLANGEERVWRKVIMLDYRKEQRPENQGGIWYLANKIKILDE